MTYHLATYGCQMNESDSERIHTLLQDNGFKSSSLDKANLAIFNVCSIRKSAVDRIWSRIHQLKKKQPSTQIILTGCILPADNPKFKQRVDLILSIAQLPNWPQLIYKHLASSTSATSIKKIKPQGSLKHYFEIHPQTSSKFSAYLPIMTGCNNFCSYCVVPYVRGREQSRPVEDILQELNKLIIQGYKDIILLGQNVNSYQAKFKGKPIDFSALLKLIDQIHGNYWLNFFSSHPKDLSNALIQTYKTNQHLTPYLHLPLQSGSNKILKAMHRRYAVNTYSKLIKQIRKIKPDIVITTDIIVGFPGETQKDFEATLKLMRTIKFDMAYLSQYSPRAGTKAAKLKDNVSKADKKQRHKILNQILKTTALENNQKLINTTLNVLIHTKQDNYLLAKTNTLKHVKIKSANKKLIGQFVKVKITHATAWGLQAKLI